MGSVISQCCQVRFCLFDHIYFWQRFWEVTVTFTDEGVDLAKSKCTHIPVAYKAPKPTFKSRFICMLSKNHSFLMNSQLFHTELVALNGRLQIIYLGEDFFSLPSLPPTVSLYLTHKYSSDLHWLYYSQHCLGFMRDSHYWEQFHYMRHVYSFLIFFHLYPRVLVHMVGIQACMPLGAGSIAQHQHIRQLHFTVESSSSNILAEWTLNLPNDLRAVKDIALNSNCKKIHWLQKRYDIQRAML